MNSVREDTRRPNARAVRTGMLDLDHVTGESGSISVTMFGCIALVVVLCLFACDLGLFLAARNRAQNAADAAALAAVTESFPLFSSGGTAREAADELARLNGAAVERLVVSGGGERVQVTVSVRPQSLVLARLGIGKRKATASAAAEVELDRLLASGRVWYTPDPERLANIRSMLASRGISDPGTVSSMVAMLALSHLGEPYVWGATGPSSFDCSGLVCYVYAQIGVRLPRVTFSQVCAGRAVSVAELQAGDLVFFRGNAHVGIYLGGGCFIHAPHTGDVVRISPLAGRAVSACRRIL